MVILAGNELVLVAQVPRASDRWKQVHLNRDIAERFFRVVPGERTEVILERMGEGGEVIERVRSSIVYSPSNKNCKLEFGFGDVVNYPDDGPPILVVVEIDIRRFRYVPLMPGDVGYDEMLALNTARPAIGRGLPRVLSTLDEVELRWPNCPLRNLA